MAKAGTQRQKRVARKPNEVLSVVYELADPKYYLVQNATEKTAAMQAFYSPYLQDSGSFDTICALANAGITLSWNGAVSSTKVDTGVSTGDNTSWYTNVGEIANGQENVQTALQTHTTQYNTLLSDFIKQ